MSGWLRGQEIQVFRALRRTSPSTEARQSSSRLILQPLIIASMFPDSVTTEGMEPDKWQLFSLVCRSLKLSLASSDPSTGLVDCGNWAVSASSTVPGKRDFRYLCRQTCQRRRHGWQASHIVFVVRNDASNADLLYHTSDATWQAYNDYGGNSLYSGSPAGRAYKVSYNRPFITYGNVFGQHTWFLVNEYPMIRWLERNGYNLTYITDLDSDIRGAELLKHKVYLSVGQDEYVSAGQRANIEAARNAGIHLAFFAGNNMFWKTRWENSIDGSTPASNSGLLQRNTRQRQDRSYANLDRYMARPPFQPSRRWWTS